jgi:predicted dehydrogenase
MGSDSLSFGICGFGFMGRTYFAHLHNHPRARVVAVCAKNNIARAGQNAEIGNLPTDGDKAVSLEGVNIYEEVDDLLADRSVDVVAITLPTPLHADITAAALESGRHVICEKPMALRLRECDRMIRTAEKTGRTLMIAQCIRFWPQYQKVKQIVDEGGVGDVKVVTLRRLSEPPDHSIGNWLLDSKRSGGAILDMHVHDIDYARHLLGMPDDIHARGHIGPSGGIDQITATWGYADGRYAIVEGGWLHKAPWPFEMRILVQGTTGTLDWSMVRGPKILHYADEPTVREIEVDETDGWQRELDYFIDCVIGGKPVERCSPDTSRVSIALAHLERRAVRTGRVISVPKSVVRRDCKVAIE